MNLTQKRENFCQKFIELKMDASKAYRASFDAKKMKDKTVWEQSSRLLKNDKVAARIKELQALHLKRHEITVDRVLQEYSKLAFLDVRKIMDNKGNILPIHEIDDEAVAAIAGLEIEDLFEGRGDSRERVGRLHKIKLSDKKGALDSLARHLGMFTDKLQIEDVTGLAEKMKERRRRHAAKTE